LNITLFCAGLDTCGAFQYNFNVRAGNTAFGSTCAGEMLRLEIPEGKEGRRGHIALMDWPPIIKVSYKLSSLSLIN
jgi:hypothetical protein